MPSHAATNTATVALIGNPNTGKSTLFTALAGVHQRIGNYPGVTVERKTGTLEVDGQPITLIDLPGMYSLAPRSPDEMLAVDVLFGRPPADQAPDAVLCVLDSSNLQRNLYLVSQVLEIGLPTIIVLNMVDVATKKGACVDAALLQERLGAPVVVTQANRQVGIDAVRALLGRLDTLERPNLPTPFPELFAAEVTHLKSRLDANGNGQQTTDRYLAERLLLDTNGYIESDLLGGRPESDIDSVRSAISASRARLTDAGIPVPAVEATSRYGWVADVLDGVVQLQPPVATGWSDRVDRLLTHKLWGSLIFLALMALMFQAVFAWAEPAMDGIETVVGWLGQQAGRLMPEGALRSLVVDGMIAGVGAILVFLPQILLLFLFIALLEDCGYMARAAYLMDKLMSKIGLSGKSFIPLLSSFACAVPGILATRVIENRRDRLVTMLIAPLMCCSARLPVYTLLVRAFIPKQSYLGGWVGLHGLTMLALYFVGMVAAIAVAWILKRTLLRGATPPFVMELPSYKRPSAKVIGRRLLDSGWAFILQAGTLILAVTVLVWAAAYFPRNAELEAKYDAQVDALHAEQETDAPLDDERLAERENAIRNARQGERIQQSYLGRAGHWIEPAVRPLGWDWRIGCAVIASFPAREVVVGTFSVLYNLGEGEDETSPSLRDRLQAATWDGTDRPIFTVPVALSIMVFYALCAQCVATLAVIKRETQGWRWPAFTFLYMTILAYVAALVTYQAGTQWF